MRYDTWSIVLQRGYFAKELIKEILRLKFAFQSKYFQMFERRAARKKDGETETCNRLP